MLYKAYRDPVKPSTASISSNNGNITQRVSVASSGYSVITPSVTNRSAFKPRISSSAPVINRTSSSASNRNGTVRGTLSKSSNTTPVQVRTPGKCNVGKADQLVEKLKVLENEQKLLSAKIERVNSILDQLTSGSGSGTECRRCTCSTCSTPPVPVPVSGPHPVGSLTSLPFKRVFIVSDSIGRDLSFHMKRNFTGDTLIQSSVKSGALFGEVVTSILDVFPNLNKDDAVIVIGGANDIPLLPPILPSCSHGFSSRSLNFNPLSELSSRTNVIVCTIPYRYDHHANLSTNIYNTNQGILFRACKYNVLSFDLNKFLSRRHFTRHGLHLNKFGKATLAKKLTSFLSDFEPEYPVSSINPVNESINSTFSFLPVQSGPFEQTVSKTSIPNDDLEFYPASLDDNVVSQSLVTVQDCSTNNIEDSFILNVSALNDDLIYDLVVPNVPSSNQGGIKDQDKGGNVKRKKKGVKKPKLVSYSSPESTPSVPSVSNSSLNSGKVVVYDRSLPKVRKTRNKKKIPALAPVSRPYIPRLAKSKFPVNSRKLGT
ncbi:hypothetical protein WDU94_008901 [Cyamophila willieti]